VKLPLYAEAGIPHYGLFNLVDRCLEAYSNPNQLPPSQYHYFDRQIVPAHNQIIIPYFSDISLELAQVFPQASS